jgi:hypothetical protein
MTNQGKRHLSTWSVGFLLLAASLPGRAEPPSPPAPEELSVLAPAFEKLKLGPSGSVSRLEMVVSSATFELKDGSLAPILVNGKEQGFFFTGEGTFTYRSSDPVEQGVVRLEAGAFGVSFSKEKGGGTVIRESFKSLLFLSNGIPAPDDPARRVGSQPIAGLAQHLDRFRRARRPSPFHLVLRAALDDPSVPTAVAEMAGDHELTWKLDLLDRKSETLSVYAGRREAFESSEFRTALFPTLISEQPVGRGHGSFVQPRFLLVDVDLRLTEEEGEEARLSVTETLLPRTGSQRLFRFDLRSGVLDTRMAYHPVRIDSVQDAAGRKLPFHFEHGSVLVALAEPAPAGEPVTVKFEISGKFLLRQFGDSYWHLGTNAWFPEPAENGQYYTWHSVVAVRKPWVAFSCGKTISRSETESHNVVETRLEVPIQFAVIHAGKYSIHERKFGDRTIRVAPYAGINDGQVDQLARLADQIIRFYEPWLGPFPFREFDIIEMNDLGWGQAPAGIMFITREAFNPLINVASRAYSNGVNQRFAHEIAHQYWGHAVKTGTSEDVWLRESLPEFCSSFVVRQISGKTKFEHLASVWKAHAKTAGGDASIAAASQVDLPNDEKRESELRFGLLYSKGAWVFEVIRRRIGDEKLFSALRTIQGQFAGRFLAADDVSRALGRVDGTTDYRAFFDRYVRGTEIPEPPES